MYILVCPNCKNADVEELDNTNKNMFWCHDCGEEWKKNKLEMITLDEYLKIDDMESVDDNIENDEISLDDIKKLKGRLETFFCTHEFDVYVGCNRSFDKKSCKKCWKKAFEKYELLVSKEHIYKFYRWGLSFAFKKKVK